MECHKKGKQMNAVSPRWVLLWNKNDGKQMMQREMSERSRATPPVMALRQRDTQLSGGVGGDWMLPLFPHRFL